MCSNLRCWPEEKSGKWGGLNVQHKQIDENRTWCCQPNGRLRADSTPSRKPRNHTVDGYDNMIGIRLELDSIIFQIFAKNYNLWHMVLTIHVSFYMSWLESHRIYPDAGISGAVDGVTSTPNAYVCKQKKLFMYAHDSDQIYSPNTHT